MALIEILRKIDIALADGGFPCVSYLNRGLPAHAIRKALKDVPGSTGILHELYAWHDGAKFVHLTSGETFDQAMLRISLLPVRSLHLLDLKLALSYFEFWAAASKKHPKLAEVGVRYMTLLFDGRNSFFLVDLGSEFRHRIMFLKHPSDQQMVEAYGSIEEFFKDILASIRRGGDLAFFREGATG